MMNFGLSFSPFKYIRNSNSLLKFPVSSSTFCSARIRFSTTSTIHSLSDRRAALNHSENLTEYENSKESDKTMKIESSNEEEEEENQEDSTFVNLVTGEIGGPRGPEPTRHGDWHFKGRCTDF